MKNINKPKLAYYIGAYHTTPCLCAIVSALKLSTGRPSHPLEFASSFLILFLRISICSLQALIKAVICKREHLMILHNTYVDIVLDQTLQEI